MSERTFGVELEFRGPTTTQYERLGVVEYSYDDNDRKFRRLLDRTPTFAGFDLGYDGSEFELRTPILQGKKGFTKLRDACNYLKDWGCIGQSYDGLHVHHGADPDYIDPNTNVINQENVIRLVESWIVNQDEIMSMCHPSRNTNYACPRWTLDGLRRLKESGYADRYDRDYGYPWGTGFGRKNLNISALNEHGTVEFRSHEGTVEADNVISWVRFGQKFMDSVAKRRNSLENLPVETLLKRVKVARNANRYLVAKSKNRGYRPALNEIEAVSVV